jgi:hypothetical protein
MQVEEDDCQIFYIHPTTKRKRKEASAHFQEKYSLALSLIKDEEVEESSDQRALLEEMELGMTSGVEDGKL